MGQLRTQKIDALRQEAGPVQAVRIDDAAHMVHLDAPHIGNFTRARPRSTPHSLRIRAAVKRAVAHLKTWRMLSEEGGRYRAPVHKFPSALKAIVALHFFAEAYE